MGTTPERNSQPRSADNRGVDPAASGAFASLDWEPLRAWGLQSLYGPIAHAIRSLTSADGPRNVAAAFERVRVLQVGGHPGVLQQLLSAGPAPLPCDVMFVAAGDQRLPAVDASVHCAVSIDWLPRMPASQRERAVGDLCRVSRVGVIIVSAFDSPAVRAASHTINDLHRAVHGDDHPLLGRPLEIGFPDLPIAQRSLEAVFPFVSVRSISDVSAWQTCEALTVTSGAVDREPSNADIAAAALYPAARAAADRDHAFRTMLIAARTSSRDSFDVPDMASVVTDGAELAVHHAVEVAAQRRSLDALVHAITTEREREREEFRATIASLAEGLRDVDARAEHLAREVRARDQSLGNLQVMLAAEQQRAAELVAQAAAAADATAQAVQTAHAAQVTEAAESTRAALAAQAAEAADATRVTLAAHAADRASAAGKIADLQARLSAAERVVEAHERFLASRAGHALHRYTRFKNFILRRG